MPDPAVGPPTAGPDDPFAGFDLETGKVHYEAFAAEIAALRDLPARGPSARVYSIARGLAWLHKNVIAGVVEPAASMFLPERADAIRTANARLLPACKGLFYCQTMKQDFGGSSSRRSAGEGVAAQIGPEWTEATELHATGKRWLDTLVGLGIVTVKESKEIRSSRGPKIVDVGSDLQAFGELYEKHWPKLSSIQSVVEDEKLRLTPERIRRMAHLGTRLSMFVGRSSGEALGTALDWTRQVVGLYELLERDYTLVRTAVVCYLEFEGRHAEAERLPRFGGLQKLDPTPKATPRAEPKPATPPVPEPSRPTPDTIREPL